MNYADYIAKVQANPGWRAILESFARFVEPAPHSRILDVGCGPGALVAIFRQEAQAFGVDYDMQMLTQTGGGVFSAGSVYQMPFANHTFDIATATNVIYLIDKPLEAVREITRILKPGGQLVMLNPSPKMNIVAATALADERGLTDFARENFIDWGRIAEEKVRWSESDLAEMFSAAGLQLVETRERIGAGLALYAKGKKV